MSSTVVECVLFPKCSVAAELSRIGQGMEWQLFLNRAMENSLITWAFETTYGSAIVGHANSLASLEAHISTFASKSYSISTALPIHRKPFMTAGEASGQIKRQTSSADQYAWIKIQAAPMPGSDTVRLSIPHSHTVAAELHDPGIPDAILDGVCVASLARNFAQPIVGFHVTVLAAKWHPVDSYSDVFKRATCMAMFEILDHQTGGG